MTPRYLSKTFVVIYWIILPLLGFLALGGLAGAVLAKPLTASLFVVPLASAALCALIGWRLFKNQRALAATRPLSKSDLELFSESSESEKTE